MKYIRVKWKQSNPNEPVWLYSELDDNRWEVRKVEIFADGRRGYAGEGREFGGTGLGEVPIPPLEEIAKDHEFDPTEITQKEFEEVWLEAIKSK